MDPQGVGRVKILDIADLLTLAPDQPSLEGGLNSCSIQHHSEHTFRGEQRKEVRKGSRVWKEGGSTSWAVSNRAGGAGPGLGLSPSKAAARRIPHAHLCPGGAFGAYMAMRRATVVLKRSKM